MEFDAADSDAEFDLEYSEDSGSESNLDLENLYYSSKSIKNKETQVALDNFNKICEQEDVKGILTFKSLKQIIKIYVDTNESEELLFPAYQNFLDVSKNVPATKSERCIKSLMEYYSSKIDCPHIFKLLLITLDVVKGKKERLEVKVYTKLGKIYLEREDHINLQRTINEIKKSCLDETGIVDRLKGNLLLDAYCLEIQMYTLQKNDRKLKDLYNQCLKIKSAIPHPMVMGIIRECGAKMYLREGSYENAKQDFFEAFKNYDECCNPRRITTLKYLVLANMLSKSDINPFDSPEAKPYKSNQQIVAMTQMVEAYQKSEIDEFLRIYSAHQQEFLDDYFIRENIEELMRSIRSKYLHMISE